jgi:hypothetical protein
MKFGAPMIWGTASAASSFFSNVRRILPLVDFC